MREKFPPKISYEEMIHSDTAKARRIDNHPPAHLMPNLLKTALFLQELRDKLCEHYRRDVPIIISSGYRSPDLNAAVGGSHTSAHMRALAADINAKGLTPLELAKFAAEHMDGYDQIIHEFGRWVHVGLETHRPRKQRLTAIKEGGRTIYKQGLLPV